MRAAVLFCALVCAFTIGMPRGADAQEIVPRTIIALYDGGDVQNTYIHTVVELPLNHLGLNVEYHSIHEPFPDIAHRKDVRGVISWFYGNAYDNAEDYLKWALDSIRAGKKFVIIGSIGISDDARHSTVSELTNRFLDKLGIKMSGRWTGQPFDVTYQYRTPSLFLTPNPYQWIRPSYESMQASNDQVTVHLIAHRPGAPPGEDSALIVTGPNGGYLDADYAVRTNKRNDEEVVQWLIDPFEFFRLAYATDDLPKPDPTTVAGRRVYYSNIDGDGWNNVTQLEEYRGKQVLSAQVIYDKVVKPYPDLPVMIAPIAADIDPDWVGTDKSREALRELWALPQVEAGTHTFTHPFSWKFFEDGDVNDEIPYLPLYKTATWQPDAEAMAEAKSKPDPKTNMEIEYSVPRAFAQEPFEVHKEIQGSIDALQAFLPKGKKIDILSWPGDCMPWEEVVHLTREAHVQNINGGDSRFDPEYPAYASLSPYGRQVGKERQIYNSTSNENTYTDLWLDNYHAFRYLKKTIDNSESPIRLSAMSIYYHIYSAEREASLRALLSNLNYARTLDIAPVSAGYYTHMVEGFYATQVVALGADTWRIDQRGALETIRFDHTSLKSVDFDRSKGIIGERHFQGSLYVDLDPSVAQPVIALKNDDHYYAPSDEPVPYLVESRWLISDLGRGQGHFDFTAQGYGDGEMVWHVTAPGSYRVRANGKTEKVEVAADRLLRVRLKDDAIQPIHITIMEAPNA